MCKYNFLSTFFQNVLLKFCFFLLKKICQSYQCAMNESRKYSITLSKKMKNKKSFPLCVRGWTDFFSLHNGALKIAFSLFQKSKKYQQWCFFDTQIFTFLEIFENTIVKNDLDSNFSFFSFILLAFSDSKTHHEIRKNKFLTKIIDFFHFMNGVIF